jgi:ubiquinone/menaquinone biosynthesis C-methylase UbiE
MKSEDAKKFTEYYREKKVTGTYDAQREGNPYRRRKRALELKHFLDLLNKRENDKILELGCSSGFLTKYLGKVTAIDTSEKMLEITKMKNPSAECISADMFEMPFKNESFDKVVTMRVWNHLDENDLMKAILESKRVLKKNGFLIFDIEDKNFKRRIVGNIYQKLFRTTGYKIYQYSINDTKKILENEGFKIVEGKILKHRVGRQIVLKCQLITK